MPALNFQPRFADAVESGDKRQTIRKARKRPIKVGHILLLYTGLRTKKCRILRTDTCISVDWLMMSYQGIWLKDDSGNWVPVKSTSLMAEADGFKDFAEMQAWFEETHGLPFYGVLIRW